MKNKIFNSEYAQCSAVIPITFLLCLASISRLYNLGEGSLIGDEMITYRESTNRLFSPFNPLYYWLVEWSRKFLVSPELLTRLPSAILSIVSIPLFFLSWRNIVGGLASFFGALLLVFLEWHLFHGQYGRFFSAVFLFAMISYVSYWKALENGSIILLCGSISAGVTALFFHFTALIVLATSAIFSVVILFANNSFRHRLNLLLVPNQLRMLQVHLILVAVCLLLMLPLALHLYNGWTARGEFTSGVVWARRFIGAIGFTGIFMAVSGYLILLKQNPRLALFVFISTFVPVCLAFFGAEFLRVREDYVFFIVPFVVLCGGIFLKRLISNASGLESVAIVFLFIALLLPSFISHYTERASLDIREVVAFIENDFSDDDQILEYAIEFRHHAQGRLPLRERLGLRWGNQPGWSEALQKLKNVENRTWIVTRTTRRGNPPEIEAWLLANARLVWRKTATRFDYSSRGYEVWLIEPKHRAPVQDG